MSRKRNITDEEISLIKAMLKLKIPNGVCSDLIFDRHNLVTLR
jgi:hypothetical protein